MIIGENKMSLNQYLASKQYPGRGIFIGESQDGAHMAIGYFIMGRSENSRNRVFVLEGNNIKTQAYDASKVVDPSLIIYSPIKVFHNQIIVTNGDQTDTIFDSLKSGKTFWEGLEKRTFEPDAPHYTPRISGLLFGKDKGFSYQLSILKSNQIDNIQTQRILFAYEGSTPGVGHLIHTYDKEYQGRLTSFSGEPLALSFKGDINQVAKDIWENLDQENKISLVVQFVNKETEKITTVVINKHQ